MNLPYNELEEEFFVRSTTPSDINEHLHVIKDIAFECKHITEFGVFIGNATIALLSGQPDIVIGYDIPETVVHGKVQKAIELICKLSKENDIQYTFHQGSVHEVDIEPTEFLFLDTNQRAKTFNELERHHINVSKYIASHDTIYLPEQYDAFMKFLEKYPDEWKLKAHYTNNNGLIIIERVK